MRKIKFRVWDENLGMDNDPIIGNHKPVEVNHAINNPPEGTIVMQYTGLKDKNGKEIYHKMLVNNIYIVCVYKNIIYLCDISDIDTNNTYIDENELEITGEYFSLSENEKRNIDKLIQQAERKINKKGNIIPIL